MSVGGGGGRLVGKPEVDGLGEISVGQGEGGTLVYGVYFMGQKDAVPNPEIIHPALEEGGVVLGTVSEGEEVADVRSQLTRTAGLRDVGNKCSVQVNRAVLSTEQSIPSEGDVLPLKKGGGFGGCQARRSPRGLANEPVLGWAGCKKPPVTGLQGTFCEYIARSVLVELDPTGETKGTEVIQGARSVKGYVIVDSVEAQGAPCLSGYPMSA